MTSAPRLLDQLANLTAIRDLELIEFSLLKSLIRLNNSGQPSMEIVYGDEKCSMRHEDIELTPEVQMADEIAFF
jgi:hypothetical protein